MNEIKRLLTSIQFGKLYKALEGDYLKTVGLVTLIWIESRERYLINGGWLLKEKLLEIGFPDGAFDCGFLETDEESRYRILNSDTIFLDLKRRSETVKSRQKAKIKRQPLKSLKNQDVTIREKTSEIVTISEKTSEKDLNKAIWFTYDNEYRKRYGNQPIRNAMVNKQVSMLGQRLGSNAIEVVKFYLTHNKKFYLEKCHPIGLCLQDAEALFTQWHNGTKVFETQARQQEQRSSLDEQFERLEKKWINQ